MNNLRFVDSGEELSFAPWEASVDKTYYLVLPSFYQKKNFTCSIIYDDNFYSFFIDGQRYQSGDQWSEPLMEDVHDLTIVDWFGNVHMEKKFQVLVSEKLPSVFVTVEEKEALMEVEEYANKQYVEKGHIVAMDETGNVVLEEQMERFKVRGNLTATLEKKPFTITLPESASLYGMSRSVNWHLLANATDGSHIRNKIMLDWADEVFDTYQPGGTYVDFYLNGEYQGLYFLSETIEVQQERVNIDSQNSLLLEMELYERAISEENHVVTKRGHYFVIHKDYPMSWQELEEVRNYVNDIENALYAEDGISEISGRPLSQLIDFDSWSDAWLLEEISADHDLGNTSQFCIVEDWENRSALKAGPSWDFDLTLGNAMIPMAENPRNLMAAIHDTRGIQSVSQNRWLSQMYLHEEFYELLREKFVGEAEPKIESLLNDEIEQYTNHIRRASVLDFLRWNGNGISQIIKRPDGFSYKKEADYKKYDVIDQHTKLIKTFLEEKKEFLHELWVEQVEFEVIVEDWNIPGMNLELNNNVYTWIRKEEME